MISATHGSTSVKPQLTCLAALGPRHLICLHPYVPPKISRVSRLLTNGGHRIRFFKVVSADFAKYKVLDRPQ
jgi:hypothetical protein